MQTKPSCLPIEYTHAEIQHAAYFLWERQGRPLGRDEDIWFAARERLRRAAPSAYPALHRPKPAATFARDAQPPARKKR